MLTLRSLLSAALESIDNGDDELLDHCLVELTTKLHDDIQSIPEIASFLRKQADLRAPENDEAGILEAAAHNILKKVAALETDNDVV